MKASYLEKAGDKLTKETLDSLMDNETWLSASEAVSYLRMKLQQQTKQQLAFPLHYFLVIEMCRTHSKNLNL